MTERPYSGRAKIYDSIKEFKIEIPVKKNWFAIIFLTGWLGAWLVGELFALSFVFGNILGSAPGGFDGFGNKENVMAVFGFFFIIFWLIGWSAAGFFTFRTWLWMIAGKEILTFDRNELIIEKKGTFLASLKTYDLREVKNFELNLISNNSSFFGNNSNRNIWNLGGDGVLKFDYGLKTIQIASGIDEAEGRYLLEKIRSKEFIKE
jgi:hypothetical protein